MKALLKSALSVSGKGRVWMPWFLAGPQRLSWTCIMPNSCCQPAWLNSTTVLDPQEHLVSSKELCFLKNMIIAMLAGFSWECAYLPRMTAKIPSWMVVFTACLWLAVSTLSFSLHYFLIPCSGQKALSKKWALEVILGQRNCLLWSAGAGEMRSA